MLALANVFDLFSHELASLCAWSLPFSRVLIRTFQRLFFRHINSSLVCLHFQKTHHLAPAA
jgi:hypothetical protein